MSEFDISSSEANYWWRKNEPAGALINNLMFLFIVVPIVLVLKRFYVLSFFVFSLIVPYGLFVRYLAVRVIHRRLENHPEKREEFVGRFNGTAEPAPEVELPGEGEPVSPLGVERRADVRAVGNCRADRVAPVVACRLLRLREEVADGDGLLARAPAAPGSRPGAASGSGGMRRRQAH